MASSRQNLIPRHNSSIRQESGISQSNRSVRTTDLAQSAAAIPQRVRNDGMLTPPHAHRPLTPSESWVEISSQPSSSSLSSIGDEIVTTGLRVQHDSNFRRRRRHPVLPSHIHLERRQGTSSTEEYDESESDEDRVMTSSNENVPTGTSARVEYDAGSDSDDDDENATALGRRTGEAAFTPQPNAFSHPPTSRPHPGSYFPSQRVTERPSYISRAPSRSYQSPYENHADHDAQLRASLTTLLSIGAAAARGLPKREQPTARIVEPMGLRFVPESELNAPANSSLPLSPSTRARSSPSISSQEAIKHKRKAAASKPGGEKTRAIKKKRILEEETMISPTLLGWVVSAGVVVLVSVVGFGAGYVIGREVGRQEAMDLAGWNGTFADGTCGREVARGSTGSLRRFRWNLGGGKGIVA